LAWDDDRSNTDENEGDHACEINDDGSKKTWSSIIVVQIILGMKIM